MENVIVDVRVDAVRGDGKMLIVHVMSQKTYKYI